MSKRFVFSAVGVLVLIGGLIAVILLVSRQQLLKQRAAPVTSLTMTPASSSVTVGNSFDVGVNIDTGYNQVAGAELHVSFDPTKVKANSASIGTFFETPQVVGPTIDNVKGTVIYSLLLPPGANPKSGSGSLVTVNFTALAAGTSPVDFTNDTVVVAVGEGGQNVLQSKTGATVNASAAAAASPTATPVGQSPTPTPIAAAAVSPTPTATSSVTPLPTVAPFTSTATPLATATLYATPTPTLSLLATPVPTFLALASAVPTPTARPSLPVSGFSGPTMIGAGAGVGMLVLGVILIVMVI